MTRRKNTKQKDPLRLVQWANDNCPPIDLNNEVSPVIELVKEIRILRVQQKLNEDTMTGLCQKNNITNHKLKEQEKNNFLVPNVCFCFDLFIVSDPS